MISVRDNGVGIDAELLPNIFELFEQGKRSLDRSQGGLGVGLTLVHRLVGLHQGTVTATSAGSGRGSEFQVVLPCLSEVGDDAAPSRATKVRGRRRARAVASSSSTTTTTPPKRPRCCSSSAATRSRWSATAARRWRRRRCSRPTSSCSTSACRRWTATRCARRLREVAETRASCLIALTGYGQPADRERARAAGFDHHLTKPADPDALLALVDAWIESSGAQRALARAAAAAVGNAVD